jgi:MoaA/NifB/PqqE/SkfB family radical SAM enzyme
VLTGGEPMLHKQLLRIVVAARRMGYYPVQIQTNGRLFAYPEMLQAYLRAGATEFSPSLHGSTAEMHEALTRAAGSWSQSVAGIRNLVQAGCTVVTNSVVVRRNVQDVPALVKLLADLGVYQAQLAYVHPVGTALELFDDVVPRLPDVVEPVRQARDIAKAAGMRLVTEALPYCFLRGMEELAVEDEIPATTVVDLAGQVANYSSWRVAEGKSHGPPCEKCVVKHRCEGPWREYPEKFGWDEFAPVTEDPFARLEAERKAAAKAC